MPKITRSPEKIEVQVRYLYVPFVSSINLVDLTFDLRLDIDLLWLATDKDKLLFSSNSADYKPSSYIPQLVFQNAKSISIESVPGESGSPYKIEKDLFNFTRLKIVGTFIKLFDCHFFPFDKQSLDMYISLSFKNADSAVFVPEDPSKDVVYVLTEFSGLVDWKITGAHVVGYVDDSNFSMMKFSILCTRIPWNIVLKQLLVVLVLTSFSIVSYTLESKGDRLGFLITVLLTVVALQFTMNSQLPPTPYIGYIDIVLISCYAFITYIMYDTSRYDEVNATSFDLQMQSVIIGFGVIVVGTFLAGTILHFDHFFFYNKIGTLNPEKNKTSVTHKALGEWSTECKTAESVFIGE